MGVTEKAVLYSRSRFSCELSEIGAAKPDGARLLREAQPPSGGCVLKLKIQSIHHHLLYQPPSGGCVLKQSLSSDQQAAVLQPPSGGCVLKPCAECGQALNDNGNSRLQAAVC